MSRINPEDYELIVPPAFRDQAVTLLGQARAEIIIALAEWMITRDPSQLENPGPDATHWTWPFYSSSDDGNLTRWVLEFEVPDERLMWFVATRIYRKD